MAVIVTRYDGFCTECGEDIAEGERAAYYGKGELYHPSCDPGPLEGERSRPPVAPSRTSLTQTQVLAALRLAPAGILGLLPDPPLELAEAAYRIQAKLNHPDKGGSSNRMKQINAAIEQLRAQKH